MSHVLSAVTEQGSGTDQIGKAALDLRIHAREIAVAAEGQVKTAGTLAAEVALAAEQVGAVRAVHARQSEALNEVLAALAPATKGATLDDFDGTTDREKSRPS